MKKYGFTLIELLAVIIILAIVALIATPLILNVIDDARDSANMSEAQLVLKAAEQAYVIEQLGLTTDSNMEFDGSTNIYEHLQFTGEKPENGNINITSDGKVNMQIYQDGKCYVKGFNATEITVTESDLDSCLSVCTDIVINGSCAKADKEIIDVATMKSDSTLVAGDLVEVNGYYYNIVDNTDGSISVDGFVSHTLDNGLVAILEAGDLDTVSVAMFGAVGDGTTDDTNAIRNAIKSDYGIVAFEENKTYKLGARLSISTSDKVIEGNNATLLIDNDFVKGSDSNVIVFDNSNNLVLQNLNVVSQETENNGYTSLISVASTSTNIEIKNNSFVLNARTAFIYSSDSAVVKLTGNEIEFKDTNIMATGINVNLFQGKKLQVLNNNIEYTSTDTTEGLNLFFATPLVSDNTITVNANTKWAFSYAGTVENNTMNFNGNVINLFNDLKTGASNNTITVSGTVGHVFEVVGLANDITISNNNVNLNGDTDMFVYVSSTAVFGEHVLNVQQNDIAGGTINDSNKLYHIHASATGVAGSVKFTGNTVTGFTATSDANSLVVVE